MNSLDILSGNHDIHFHSRDFSDGAHEIAKIARFAARWQRGPRWVGLSDHNPPNNTLLNKYIDCVSQSSSELNRKNGITLLAGLEMDCSENGSAAVNLDTARLDYGLAAYHGGKFSAAPQVENYFMQCAQQPFCDVAAHPDRFLGNVDCSTINWEKIFNHFSEKHVLCEYNLTTPLSSPIFAIAARLTDVKFIIASDTHDFHDLAVTRIVNAWSESLAGNFEFGFQYLRSLLRVAYSPRQVEEFSVLFGDNASLHRLQYRLVISSFDPATGKTGLTPEEKRLHKALLKIPECDLDKDFLLSRFDRFADLDAGRIISLLSVEEFKNTIQANKVFRKP